MKLMEPRNPRKFAYCGYFRLMWPMWACGLFGAGLAVLITSTSVSSDVVAAGWGAGLTNFGLLAGGLYAVWRI